MSYTLEQFMDRATKERNRSEQIFNWHVRAFTDAGIPLPYNHDEQYTSINQHDDEYEIDVEKTLDMIAKVVQYATSRGFDVTKTYDYDFNIRINIDDKITVVYIAKRESVCTKKVVGTKVVPATITEEKIEEVIEWECEPVSFLAREV